MPRLNALIEKSLTATLSGILALAMSGCLMSSPRRLTYDSSKSAYSGSSFGASSGAAGDDDAYNCPSSPNVTPDYDWMLNGTGRFKVCTNNSDPSNIKIHGATAYSDIICIYPVKNVSYSEVYLFEDQQTGGILSQCVQATEYGVFASFPDTDFNAVFIVEAPWQGQLEMCLAGPEGPNYYFCPGVTGDPRDSNIGYYSYGTIR